MRRFASPPSLTSLTGLPALAALAALPLLLAAPDARAGCEQVAPTRICKILEAAPHADPADPRVAQVIAVWRRVEAPFSALSGRETGLVVLDDKARVGRGSAARPIPPAAYTCPGAPPVVYVPWTLVDLVLVRHKYPVDFLAFVLGHELGHRANDFDPGGCQLAAFQRPGKGVHEEELADKRSAFFTAVGGYSTRAIARKELVGRFLEQEYRIRKFTVEKRKEALLKALTNMDAFEGLYQSALILAFSGDITSASRLLARADELIRAKSEPVPELLVVRALVLMLKAAPRAPWLGRAKLPLDGSHLRCAPLFPGHTALYEEPEAGAEVRAAGAELEAARRALKMARKLLDDAADMGAADLIIASARACLAFYGGDAASAARYSAEARQHAGGRAPRSVLSALRSNDALIAFLAEVSRRPAPVARGDAKLRKWARAFARKIHKFKHNARVVAFSKALARLPNRGGAAVAAIAKPRCTMTRASNRNTAKGSAGHGSTGKMSRKAAAGRVARLALPEIAPTEVALGTCPKGFTLAYTVPSLQVGERSGGNTGVTTCVPSDGRKGIRWVRVNLPQVMSPPMEAVSVSMRIVERGAMALPGPSQLACSCDEMVARGTSDRGEKAWMVVCEKLGLQLGVVFVRADGSADRLAVID